MTVIKFKRTPTRLEVNRLHRESKRKPEHWPLFCALVLAEESLLRFSEMQALQWGNVKLDGATPYIRVPVGKHRARIIPLNSDATTVLRKAHAERKGFEQAVFPVNLSRQYSEVKNAAGLPWLTMGHLRAHYIARFIERASRSMGRTKY